MFILINHVLLYFYFQLSYNVCRGENMELIKNIIIYGILGAIQGFSEPIPISSSGHLVIFQAVISNMQPTNLGLEKAASILSLNINPPTAAGIVATINKIQ